MVPVNVGGWGLIPGRVETLGSVSVNHSITGLRCKNGTSACREDRMCTSPAWNVWRWNCSHSHQGDSLYHSWVGPCWEVKSENCKPLLTRKYASCLWFSFATTLILFQSGLTPLHLAAQSGHEGLVRMLLNSQGVQADAATNVQVHYHTVISYPWIYVE